MVYCVVGQNCRESQCFKGTKCHGQSREMLDKPFLNLSTPLESPRRAAGTWSLTHLWFSTASGHKIAIFEGHA